MKNVFFLAFENGAASLFWPQCVKWSLQYCLLINYDLLYIVAIKNEVWVWDGMYSLTHWWTWGKMQLCINEDQNEDNYTGAQND